MANSINPTSDLGNTEDGTDATGARPKVLNTRNHYKPLNGFLSQNIDNDLSEDSDENLSERRKPCNRERNALTNGHSHEWDHAGPSRHVTNTVTDDMENYFEENQHLLPNIQGDSNNVNDVNHLNNSIEDNLLANEKDKAVCSGDKSTLESKGLVTNGFCYCKSCFPNEMPRPTVQVQVSFEDNGGVDSRVYCDNNFERQESGSINGSYEALSGKQDTCSPDTDFLDFDFDPGPSGDETAVIGGNDLDSTCSDSLDEDDRCLDNREPVFEEPQSSNDLGNVAGPSTSSTVQNQFIQNSSFPNQLSSPKYQNVCLRPLHREDSDSQNVEEASLCSDNTDSDSINLEACSERLLRRESSLFNIPTEDPDCDECNLQSALYNSFKSKVPDKQALFPGDEDSEQAKSTQMEPVFIWSEREAFIRQVPQINTSACGPTAVINVLLALDYPHTLEQVIQSIPVRLRSEGAPIPEYLFSRSVAGTAHCDLIEGMEKITQGEVTGRFFAFYPKRKVNLLLWLAHWIEKGAVPVCTLNLQRGVPPEQIVPDAWHHQMVFGVGSRGVYLTNPVECVPAKLISVQLCSKPILLVRRGDIICRWAHGCDLSPLVTCLDTRWRDMNVLGGVVNVLREHTSPKVYGYKQHLTTHLAVPAAYQSGVTIFARKDSEVYKELVECPDLPLASNHSSS